MAELTRQEICLGARSWIERHGHPAEPDANRVYHCMCELGDRSLEDCVARLADSDEPLTLDRARAAWQRLSDMADQLRQGYL
jgi:hypothetical protein